MLMSSCLYDAFCCIRVQSLLREVLEVVHCDVCQSCNRRNCCLQMILTKTASHFTLVHNNIGTIWCIVHAPAEQSSKLHKYAARMPLAIDTS
jgi:hypothetical protein